MGLESRAPTDRWIYGSIDLDESAWHACRWGSVWRLWICGTGLRGCASMDAYRRHAGPSREDKLRDEVRHQVDIPLVPRLLDTRQRQI